MSEMEVSGRQVDPFDTATSGNKREEIQFVNSKCMTCGEMGEWVRVVRDDSGRLTKYTMFDADHYEATGGRKGKGHREFHHFTLTRNHSEVFTI